MTVTYSVEGMTCGHCVNSVSGEVGAIDGVTSVSVDLKAGTVTLSSTAPIAVDAVAKAVDEAGYRLVA
ncbi:heavy-metal-associated domain-containing protein [Actinorhabdospora filicis]|uniref:heavy-metal-associated domain-containing protein n=1 Tax=Actinorhabdospora filicis TaxID=1785913 RepID=UPI002555B9AC|nr:copper ion binding protein [Actinorhabdospora filicis]